MLLFRGEGSVGISTTSSGKYLLTTHKAHHVRNAVFNVS